MRIPNSDVLDNTESALKRIAAVLSLPLSGRGMQGEGVIGYHDIPGFCKSATLEEIRGHGHILTPGRYVGAEPQPEDAEPFADKMKRLTAELDQQFTDSAKLEKEIRKNLAGLGHNA